MDKVNLVDKFSLFQDYWSPKIAGELNDSNWPNSKGSLSGIIMSLRPSFIHGVADFAAIGSKISNTKNACELP